MKTRNTIYALLTVLMSMVGVSAFAHDIEVANSDGKTIYYRWIYNQTELAVSYQGSSYRYNSNRYTGTVVIPSTVTYNGNSYPVAIIDDYAFAGCSGLTSVTIPNSVTTIGFSAFEDCRGLTEVTIPNSVTRIMDSAFLGTAWYNNQPDGIVYAGNIAYKYKGTMPSNTSIILREGTVGIGDGAFEDCSDLTSVTIPNSVTSIPQYAFCGCSGLTEVTIPNSVTSIGIYAFYGTAWYESQPDGIVYAGNIAYKYKGTMPSNTSIILREGTVGIGDDAFYGCSGLTSVTIPNSVTTIGIAAFKGCSGLTSVTIPNSVTNIGNGAFGSCNSLTSISVESGNTNYDSRDNCNAIIKTTSNTLIAGCKNTVIPTSVTSVRDGAFQGCSGLTSVTIPSSVTSIGISAFQGCSGLTSVTIPNSVTNIGDRAFEDCSDLTSVTIPNSVTSIPQYAFCRCSGLTEVTIPSSVTSIGNQAFYNCYGLTSVTVEMETPLIIDSNTFTHRANATLYVPVGSKAAYQAANYWKEFKEIVEFEPKENITFTDANVKAICVQNWDTDGDGELSLDEAAAVTSITNNSGFRGNDDITSFDELQYFTGLTSIGNQAFSGCTKLTSVTIPESVTNLGDDAFYNTGWYNNQSNGIIYLDNWLIKYKKGSYGNIVSLTVKNGTKGIADGALKDCSSLASIIIPNSVTSIGMLAFSGCSGLTSVHISDLAAWCNINFGNHMSNPLYYAHHLYLNGVEVKDLVIPNSVTSIRDFAFYGCNSLNSVTIPNSVTSIGEGTFFYCCSGLTSIVVESGNTVYDSRDNCNAIIRTADNELIVGCQNTVIPNSVTTIGVRAFADCSGLTSVTIPNSVTSIGEGAFSGCSGLTSVTIPKSVTSIGYDAFTSCTGSLTIDCNIPDASRWSSPFYNNKFKEVIVGNSVSKIGAYAFYNSSELFSITIGNSVTSIRHHAFSNCRGLTSVTIPNSVTSIENEAFFYCRNLTSVTIPNSVTSIGYDAFAYCSGLTSVNIPNSMTSIGNSAFRDCSGLRSVTIPNSVTSIGNPFLSCSGLNSVKVDKESPLSIESYAFPNRANATLYVPKGSKAAYQSANFWKEFKAIVEFPDADVNQDGEIDVVDVVDIARFVVGTPGDTFVEFLADLNSDDNVNVADAVVLVNEIAGDQNFAKAYGAPRQNLGDDRLTLTKNDDHSLSLAMESRRPYTAFQFDLYTNSEDDVMNLRLNAVRKNGHQLLYNKVDEGHYRIVALSVANNGFNGNNGGLLNIQLDGFNSADMTISNIHFITTDGTDHRFDDLSLSSVTGIESLTPAPSSKGEGNVYDLSGRKVSESSVLPKGVYIVNGKKVIVK